MKLKKIAALCKQRKRAIIYQRWKADPDPGERKMTKQFISNGYGVYAAHGLPPLNKEGLLRIFDVEEKDFDKWFVSILDLPVSVNLEDWDESEYEVTGEFPPFLWNETAIHIFGTKNNGVMFISGDLMSPMDGENDLRFFVRDSGRNKYLAVKSGIFLQAVIMPEQLMTKKFVSLLKELTFRAETQLLNDSVPQYELTIDSMEKSVLENQKTSPEEKPEEDQEEQLEL